VTQAYQLDFGVEDSQHLSSKYPLSGLDLSVFLLCSMDVAPLDQPWLKSWQQLVNA
jgi:hypothetical protein